ncbi:MAG: TonB-dependent receptor [Novosphingobium sp.]|nr:TonB-dependent receptor [Novosphingobium sp.]
MGKIFLAGAAGAALIAGHSAHAQGTSTDPVDTTTGSYGSREQVETASGNDIIVTARRREESLQDVPVVMTAFGKEQIDRLGIASVDDVASFTPSFLSYSDGSGSTQGVTAIRGVSTGFLVTGGNQAVSTNVDGIQINQGIGNRPSQVDIAHIEVLKGPQALFFGKNSTGGIVSFRSADPTDELFVQARMGYEFQARERLGELIVSGPLSEELGARVVVYGSKMDGFQRNLYNGDRLPGNRELFGRLTLAYKDNAGNFDARLKVSYFDQNGNARGAAMNRTNCQLPALGDDCRANNKVFAPDVPGREPYQYVNQLLSSLEMNYHFGDGFTLTSVTGYQESKVDQDGDSTAGGLVIVPAGNVNKSDAFSQEVRIFSDSGGPLNFMVGGLYEKANFTQLQHDLIFGPYNFPDTFQKIKTNTYSAFAQLSYDLSEQIEFSSGLRYSNIKSKYGGETLTRGSFLGFPLATVGPIGNGFIERNSRKFTDLSPEFTVTWKPTPTVTLFGAYKEGFKAGGFDVSSTRNPLLAAPLDISYGAERAKGGELGFKTEWFDRSLRFNGAVYRYDYSDLQLSVYDPSTVSVRIYNAASSRVQGAEIDLAWTPPEQQAFTLFGALSYNRARFRSFIADCTQSQIAGVAGGCVDRDGAPGLQTSDANDVSGRPLPFAPKWSGSVGFNFDHPISDEGTKFRANATFVFSSSYLANSNGAQDPLDFENGYTQVNGGIGIHNEEKGWALDLSVRNLLNEYYVRQSIDLPGAGLERQQLISRPREVMLQLTLRPSQLFR